MSKDNTIKNGQLSYMRDGNILEYIHILTRDKYIEVPPHDIIYNQIPGNDDHETLTSFIAKTEGCLNNLGIVAYKGIAMEPTDNDPDDMVSVSLYKYLNEKMNFLYNQVIGNSVNETIIYTKTSNVYKKHHNYIEHVFGKPYEDVKIGDYFTVNHKVLGKCTMVVIGKNEDKCVEDENIETLTCWLLGYENRIGMAFNDGSYYPRELGDRTWSDYAYNKCVAVDAGAYPNFISPYKYDGEDGLDLDDINLISIIPGYYKFSGMFQWLNSKTTKPYDWFNPCYSDGGIQQKFLVERSSRYKEKEKDDPNYIGYYNGIHYTRYFMYDHYFPFDKSVKNNFSEGFLSGFDNEFNDALGLFNKKIITRQYVDTQRPDTIGFMDYPRRFDQSTQSERESSYITPIPKVDNVGAYMHMLSASEVFGKYDKNDTSIVATYYGNDYIFEDEGEQYTFFKNKINASTKFNNVINIGTDAVKNIKMSQWAKSHTTSGWDKMFFRSQTISQYTEDAELYDNGSSYRFRYPVDKLQLDIVKVSMDDEVKKDTYNQSGRTIYDSISFRASLSYAPAAKTTLKTNYKDYSTIHPIFILCNR